MKVASIIRLDVLFVSILLLGGCESTLQRQVVHYEQVRDYTSAIEVLEREVQRDPGNSEARFHLGRLYFEVQRFAEGREALLEAMSLSERFDERAQYELDSHLIESLEAGLAALGGKKLDEAVQQFYFATQINPASLVAFKGYGNALYANNQLNEAEAAFDQAVQLAGDDIEARMNLAELTLRRGDYGATIHHAQAVLAIDPEHRDAKRRLAYGAMLAGQYELADETFQQYIQTASGAPALRDYAFMNFNAGRYEEAIPYITELVEQGDSDGKLRFMLGEAYLALDRYQDMIAVYEDLSLQFPENVYALQGLIIAHERLGNVAELLRLQSKLKAMSENKMSENK